MTWIDVAYYAAGLIISAFVAYITTNAASRQLDKKLKYEREEKKEERKLAAEIESAKDLDKILYPALNTYFVDEFLKRPKYLSHDFWYYLENEDDEDLKFLLHQILGKNPQQENIKNFANFVHETYAERLNLSAFLHRYNKGSYRAVDLDIDMLNQDIEFVNKHLGKHYKIIVKQS